MFNEPPIFEPLKSPKQFGWIEVICGSMFSGKTEELIRRLNRAKFAKQKIEIFKPMTDTRYSEEEIVSHDKNSIRSTVVSSASEILLFGGNSDVVGIDEAQFFDLALVEVCTELSNQGKRVIVAGLDMDYKGIPFGPMPALMSVAEFVTKVHAICVKCGDIANHSFRIVANDKQILLGETDSYEPRCRKCFFSEEMKK